MAKKQLSVHKAASPKSRQTDAPTGQAARGGRKETANSKRMTRQGHAREQTIYNPWEEDTRGTPPPL